MGRYEEKIAELRQTAHDTDYELQLTKIRGKISAQKTRSRMRNAAVALLLFAAVYGSIFSPNGYWNMSASKDNNAVSYVLNDDPGSNNALSEYVFME